MNTLRELYKEWSNLNPYGFQKTLLNIFTQICGSFNELADLPYDTVSMEMFEVVINHIPSSRKQDNMRYLLNTIDRYLKDHYGLSIEHPSMSDEQAVWMILHVRESLDYDEIRERVQRISGRDLPFEVLGAKHLISLYGEKASDTIDYHRKSIILCNRIFGQTLPDIPQTGYERIIAEAPSWIIPMLHGTLRAIAQLDTAARHSHDTHR